MTTAEIKKQILKEWPDYLHEEDAGAFDHDIDYDRFEKWLSKSIDKIINSKKNRIGFWQRINPLIIKDDND